MCEIYHTLIALVIQCVRVFVYVSFRVSLKNTFGISSPQELLNSYSNTFPCKQSSFICQKLRTSETRMTLTNRIFHVCTIGILFTHYRSIVNLNSKCFKTFWCDLMRSPVSLKQQHTGNCPIQNSSRLTSTNKWFFDQFESSWKFAIPIRYQITFYLSSTSMRNWLTLSIRTLQ